METDADEWITVAYVPSEPTEKRRGGTERSRCRRMALLQSVLFLALRDLVGASHTRVQVVDADRRELLSFPHVLMCLCDQPEERAILSIKPCQGAHPCSACMAPQASIASPTALTSKQRTLLNRFHKQLQAFGLLQQGRKRQRRLQMEKAVRMSSYPPALAAMAGLTTAQFLLYKIIGFYVLHVSWAFFLSRARFSSCCVALLLQDMNADWPSTHGMYLTLVSCQILDLGVARLLMQRFVDIFPSLCAGYVPLCGSLIATYAEGNGRIQYLCRRCRASRTSP